MWKNDGPTQQIRNPARSHFRNPFLIMNPPPRSHLYNPFLIRKASQDRGGGFSEIGYHA